MEMHQRRGNGRPWRLDPKIEAALADQIESCLCVDNEGNGGAIPMAGSTGGTRANSTNDHVASAIAGLHENPQGRWATSEEVSLLSRRDNDLEEKYSLLQKEHDELREELRTLREEVFSNKEADGLGSPAPSQSSEEPTDEWQDHDNEKEQQQPRAALAPPQQTKVDDSERNNWPLLPSDTFSFLVFAEPASYAFICGTFVTCVQFLMLTLLTIDVFQSGSDGNLIGVPSNVTSWIRVVQVVAIMISILSQEDVHHSLNLVKLGYDEKALRDAFGVAVSWNMWVLSLTLRFLEGLFGIFATFLLIMTESTARDILLNFTAIQFVSYLDDATFVLAM